MSASTNTPPPEFDTVNLTRCPACQHLVSKEALACPGCGHPHPGRASRAEPSGAPPRRLTVEPPRLDDATSPESARSLPDGFRATGDVLPPANRDRGRLERSTKSRGVYIVLGILLGTLGVHNFYSGRYGLGVAQLAITLLLGWTIVVLGAVGVWILIELIVTDTDGLGRKMEL